jgi:hypothetical protein
VEAIQDSPEYKQRRAAILSGELGADVESALAAVTDTQAPRPSMASAAGQVLADLGPQLQALTTRPIRTGETVEAPSIYAMRVLSAPTSAAVGAVEGVLSPMDVGAAIGRRIRQGEGFVGGGRDLGDMAGELAGFEQDAPQRVALRTLGAGLGLAGEFLVPLDLGATAVARAGSKALRSAQLATSTGADVATSARVARQTLQRPSRRTVNDSLVDMVADTEEVQTASRDLARVLEEVEETTPPPPEPEPPSTQAGLFGEPPPPPEPPSTQAGLFGEPPPEPPSTQVGLFGEPPPPPEPPSTQAGLFGDAAPPPPEPPSTQVGLFGDAAPPPPTVVDEAVDTLTARLRRVGIDEDVDAFVRRLESSNVVPARIGRAVRQAIEDGEDVLAVLRRAAPPPGMVRRVGSEAQTVDDVAGVLALQAGARAVRAADLAGPRVRITPRLVAERDTANKLFRDAKARPLQRVTAALRRDSSFLVPAQPGGEVRVRLRDLVADVDGVDMEDVVAAGLSIPDDVDVVPLRVLNEAVLDDFESMALASGKVEEVTPTGGRLDEAAAPALAGEELKQAIRPVELRPGKLRASLEPRLPSGAFDDVDPALRPMVEELSRRWAGIDDEFVSLMSQQRGVPRPVAFARVMAGAYDSPAQMVGDVLANLYGGFETMGDIVFGAASHKVIMNLAATPAKLRAEVAGLFRLDDVPPDLAELFELFAKVGPGEEWGEATLSALLRVCRRLINEETTLKSMGGRIDTKPVFPVERLVDLFSASYFQRRTAAIVSEVFTPEKLRSTGVLAEFAPAEFIAALRDQLNATKYGRPLNDRDVVEMLGFALCDEAVYRRANNPQQTWMFADLGPTVPAPIRELLGDLTEAQQKELYSAVRDRAIEMTQATPVRSNYNEALARYIELYADNKVNTPLSRLEALGIPKDARRRLSRLASPESYKKMMQRIRPDDPENNRLLLRLGDTMSAGYSGLERWCKGGILAGRLLPNLVYMGVNVLTAPTIVYSTLGPAAGARAALRVGGVSMGALTPLRVFHGQTQLATTIVARSPSGKIYTAGDVARLIPQISTQGSAELSEDVLRSVSAWSGLSARRAADPAVETVRGAGQRRARRVLRQWTGLDLSGLADDGASIQINVFNQAADAQDMYFRMGVLVDALNAGRTTDEAVTLANDALFDYGRVSDFEKQYISRVVWFWSFRRESLRTTMINSMEAPERFRAAYQATKVFDDDDQYTVATKDYMALRPFIKMVEDPETRRRIGIYGPSVPTIQGVAELVDYMSGGVLLLDGILYTATAYDASPELFRPGGGTVARRGFEAASVLTQRGIQFGLGQTANPWATLVSEVALGIQRQNEGSPISDYLDPRLLAYMHLNPDAEAMLFGLVNIERVPIEDEIPGNGTFLGRQWRIADDAVSRRNYAVLRHAMLFAGFDRTLRDYAPMYHAAMTSDGEQLPVQLRPGMIDNEALDIFFRSIGAATPTSLPTVEERERGNVRSLEYIIREAQR